MMIGKQFLWLWISFMLLLTACSSAQVASRSTLVATMPVVPLPSAVIAATPTTATTVTTPPALPSATNEATEPVPTIVTRMVGDVQVSWFADQDYPTNCSPTDVVQRLDALFDAMSRGDPNVVAEFFGKKNHEPFQWYSINEIGKTEAESRNFVTYTLERLKTYFVERHQQHERLKLRQIMVNSWQQERNLVHFGIFTVSRKADDLPPNMGGRDHLADGKGAFNCQTRTFEALIMTMVMGLTQASPPASPSASSSTTSEIASPVAAAETPEPEPTSITQMVGNVPISWYVKNSYPPQCGPTDVAQRLIDLFDAINHGDPNVVSTFFGDGYPFNWYSMTEVGHTETEKNHFVAYNTPDLAAYFARRFQQHEHFTLRHLRVNNWEQQRNIVHFGVITASREADDLRPGLGGPDHTVLGKGAFNCQTRTFVVLSMGMAMDQQ